MRDPQRELEHLRKLATADPQKRFGKLHKLIQHEAFLSLAWAHVRTNKGSRTPGVDGQQRDDIDQQTIQVLAMELAHKRYQPQPVRRVYIAKANGQKRALGVSTLQDRIVQAVVAKVLEAIYEPIFRDASYGFRPGRSTADALRHVARSFRTGATWIIEGDLAKCFDSLPHRVILGCLRKRIKDERFIDLICRMLKVGVMDGFRYEQTYSGTPQGSILSPILSNIVLHEFDTWMEQAQQANPPRLTAKEQQARLNPDYARLTRRLTRWRAQLAGRRPMGRQTVDGLRAKIKATLKARQQTPCYRPRRVIYYCRYADDYVVVLCHYSKAEACALKAAMAQWLQRQLGVTQHPEKTRITHWRKSFRFLGYQLRGQRTPRGTCWLRLRIPPEAERDLKRRLKRLCGYTQIPATDLLMSVNALLRGWTQYYRYAYNATRRFGYLTGVAFWLVAHYLGRKHRSSIRKLMRRHYGIDPKTGHRALYITRPDGEPLFLWNKPPKRRSILAAKVKTNDVRPVTMMGWAGGRSYERRLALMNAQGHRCQHCGRAGQQLVVHHCNRLGKLPTHKRGPGHIIASGEEQQGKLLCSACHRQHHPGGWRG